MPGTRAKSKAMFLPDLEIPVPSRQDSRNVSGRAGRWIEITGIGERCLNLARLDRTKYLALLVIMTLGAVLRAHG